MAKLCELEPIKTEIDGVECYKVLLGTFGVYNKSGIFYYSDNIDELIKPESLIGQHLANGSLIMEREHPDISSVKTKEELESKIITLRTDNEAAIIHRLELMHTGVFDKDFNQEMIRVIGYIVPSGPHGEILKRALDQKCRNVHFSLRSLVKQQIIGGVVTRRLTEFVTYDWVFLGGIPSSNQLSVNSVQSSDMDCTNNICKSKMIEDVTPGVENHGIDVSYVDINELPMFLR